MRSTRCSSSRAGDRARLRTPTLAAQPLALAALGVLVITRIQAAALLAAYVGAAVGLRVDDADRPNGPRIFAVSTEPARGRPVGLAPAAASTARGAGLFGWLGGRSSTFDGFHASEVPQWLESLAAGVVLYVAVFLSSQRRSSCRSACRNEPPIRSVSSARSCFPLWGDAAQRRHRQRLVRRRRRREPQRAIRLLRDPTYLHRAGARGSSRDGAPATMGVVGVGAACLGTASSRRPTRLQRRTSGDRVASLEPLSLSAAGVSMLWRARPRRRRLLAHVQRPNRGTSVGSGRGLDGRCRPVRSRVESRSLRRRPQPPSGARRRRGWTMRCRRHPRRGALGRGSARKGLPDSFYFWLMVTEFFNRSIGDVYGLARRRSTRTSSRPFPSVGPGQRSIGRDGDPVQGRVRARDVPHTRSDGMSWPAPPRTRC